MGDTKYATVQPQRPLHLLSFSNQIQGAELAAHPVVNHHPRSCDRLPHPGDAVEHGVIQAVLSLGYRLEAPSLLLEHGAARIGAFICHRAADHERTQELSRSPQAGPDQSL